MVSGFAGWAGNRYPKPLLLLIPQDSQLFLELKDNATVWAYL